MPIVSDSLDGRIGPVSLSTLVTAKSSGRSGASAIAFASSSPYPEQAEAFDDVFDERLPIPDFLQTV